MTGTESQSTGEVLQTLVNLIWLAAALIIGLGVFSLLAKSSYFNRAYTIEDLKHIKYAMLGAGSTDMVIYSYQGMDTSISLRLEAAKITAYEPVLPEEVRENFAESLLLTRELPVALVDDTNVESKTTEISPAMDIRKGDVIESFTPKILLAISGNRFVAGSDIAGTYVRPEEQPSTEPGSDHADQPPSDTLPSGGKIQFRETDDLYIVEAPLEPQMVITSVPGSSTTSAWAEEKNIVAATNANFYEADYSPKGIVASDGRTYVEPGYFDDPDKRNLVPGVFAVYLDENNAKKIHIFDAGEDYDMLRHLVDNERLISAVSGTPLLIKDCSIREIPGWMDAERPRTAIAVDETGNRLYLIVMKNSGGRGMVEKLRQNGICSCGSGKCSLLNLDGGGSATLWADKEFTGLTDNLVFSGDIYESGVYNIQPPKPERRVANHIGLTRG